MPWLWNKRPYLFVFVQEPSLADFTATDRRKVIDRLLADDYVLEALHHVIFSAPEASVPYKYFLSRAV